MKITGFLNQSVAPSESHTVPAQTRKTYAPHLPHLSGIDGLRAIAVAAVVLYHIGLSWIPGGFLGVEVFFVVSGYLITSLLLAEWRKTGRTDLPAFWLRRARRLLPALFALLVAVLAFAVVVLPKEVADLRADALAAFAYVTNWYQILSNKSYFESVGRPPLLQHLWSLAVEEQFYLVWPVLFVVGTRLLSLKRLLQVTVAGALLSTLLMALLYVPDADPSRVYYGTDTRAAALLFGAALAFGWQRDRLPAWAARITPGQYDLLGIGALALLLVFFLKLNQYEPALYRGGFAIVSLATAVVIAVVAHPETVLGWLLDRQPLRWIGLRSYSIYLWHWPVLSLTRPRVDVALDGCALNLLRLGFTCILAELSYRFVETPIRRGALARWWQQWHVAQGDVRHRLNIRWGGIGAALVVLFVAVAIAKPAAPSSDLDDLAAQAAKLTPAATVAAALPTTTFVPVNSSSIAPTAASTVAVNIVTATPKLAQPTSKPGVKDVTVFGDSVTLGAADDLKLSIGDYEMVAEVGLHFSSAIDLVKERHDKGTLSRIVIIALGSNGGITDKYFDQMMEQLKEVPQVIFVNNKVPRQWESGNNDVFASGAGRYKNVTLVDWYKTSIDHPDYFKEDGFHLTLKGREVYSQLIAKSIKR